MQFAQRVFTVAGVLGLLVLPPFYFLAGFLGGQLPPEITHPEFYYGFLGATIAWQIVYLLIGQAPSRFRHVMPLAAMAKGTFVAAVGTLFALARVPVFAVLAVVPDLLFVVLFVWSYLKIQDAPKDWN
jgi:hypothetical protein